MRYLKIGRNPSFGAKCEDAAWVDRSGKCVKLLCMATKKVARAQSPRRANSSAGEAQGGNVSTGDRPTANLTPLQERFVYEYIKDLHGSAAYQRASPGISEPAARANASRLLATAHIAAAVNAARVKIVEKLELSSERVLREVARLSFFDARKLFDEHGNPKPLHELDDDTAAAIAGLEVQQIGLGGAGKKLPALVKKYKLSDKRAALDMAMRHLGEYEKHNKQITDPVRALLDGMRGSSVPVVAKPESEEEDAP